MTVPITFESACNTETYTEAKEREHSRKHEQATCVTITFIDGAMINLIKTQMENTLINLTPREAPNKKKNNKKLGKQN